MSALSVWPEGVERIITDLGQGPGPLLICLSAMHGNEPAGVLAARRVHQRLIDADVPLSGRLVVLACNLSALDRRERFCDEDLNRAWTPRRMADVRAGRHATCEDREMHALLSAIDGCLAQHKGPWFVLDLHTTSSDTAPFAVIGDSLANRRFAGNLPVPRVLGLEECIGGTVTDYLNSRGAVTIGFEAGQHDAVEAVDCAEAALWLALAGAGIVPADREEVHAAYRVLDAEAGELPRFMEVRHYHPVRADDGFRMVAGYENFRPVEAGELLASDRNGDIRAPRRARVLMPLYQELGGDGFFLATRIENHWLWLSTVLRQVHLPALVHWLPGVRRDPHRRYHVIANRRVARWLVLDLFHLLGYRYREGDDHYMVFSRRAHDIDRDTIS